MKTLKVLTIVAITGLAGTVAANACPSNGQKQEQCQKKQQTNKQDKCQKNKKHSRKNDKMYRKGEMKEIFQKLDLTSEQKLAMKSQLKGMREQMKAKRAQMHGERGMASMSKYISANGFDKQGFMEMASKRSQKMAEMRANMFEKKISILTAEQRVKLATLLQEK